MTSIESLADTLGFGQGHGYTPTFLPSVTLFGANKPESTCPQSYSPGLVFILKGKKKGRACGKIFETSKERFLLLTNTYPLECETLATGSAPLLGLYLDLDKQEIGRQIEILDRNTSKELVPNLANSSIVHSLPMTSSILAQLERLIEILHSKSETEILGQGALSGLMYELLKSDARPILCALVTRDNKLARISKAMNFIENHLDESIQVDNLAELAGMSSSVFHRSFKETTGDSPLQYIKKMRLNQAKYLMVYQSQSATQAALNVGYESPNQFSREFKRYFGVTPSQAKKLPYSDLTGT